MRWKKAQNLILRPAHAVYFVKLVPSSGQLSFRAAGLAAAQQLQKRGVQVVVLEGHGRPGGRVYTRRLEVRIPCARHSSTIQAVISNVSWPAKAQSSVQLSGVQAGGLEAVADMGGSILTGIDGNPLAVLAKQLHIPMHDIETLQVLIYLADGTTPPKFLDEQVSNTEGPCSQGKVRGLAACSGPMLLKSM